MFTLLSTDPHSSARRGRLATRRGVIETPIFMPVGTQATVKTLTPQELENLGAQIILGNTYHLNLRPGLEVIGAFDGLHGFMQWPKPILTDSGGFQVFSLAKLRKITPDGVSFQNHLDGTPTFLSPESALEIQRVLDSDIAMLLDECPPYPCEYDYAKQSMDLTLSWARRASQWIDEENQRRGEPNGQLHFPIVQGSVYADLRSECAQQIVAMRDWPGYAVGGVSVGEPEEEMMQVAEWSVPHLPEDKPRYAMGLGTPPQILELIARGIDMFDCVLPTRLARNGTAFTETGTINLKNNRFRLDREPIEQGCTCPACQGFSRAYLRHLIKAEEILGLRLLSLHNVHFYLNLTARARHALEEGTFDDFRRRFTNNYQKHDQKHSA